MMLLDMVMKIVRGEEEERWDPETDETMLFLKHQQEEAKKKSELLREAFPSYESLLGVDRDRRIQP
jgi:hypothetical protein